MNKRSLTSLYSDFILDIECEISIICVILSTFSRDAIIGLCFRFSLKKKKNKTPNFCQFFAGVVVREALSSKTQLIR